VAAFQNRRSVASVLAAVAVLEKFHPYIALFLYTLLLVATVAGALNYCFGDIFAIY
jgi:hypothetical protein